MARALPRLRHCKLRDEESDEADVNRAGGWSRKTRILRMEERFVAAVRRVHALVRTTSRRVSRSASDGRGPPEVRFGLSCGKCPKRSRCATLG